MNLKKMRIVAGDDLLDTKAYDIMKKSIAKRGMALAKAEDEAIMGWSKFFTGHDELVGSMAITAKNVVIDVEVRDWEHLGKGKSISVELTGEIKYRRWKGRKNKILLEAYNGMLERVKDFVSVKGNWADVDWNARKLPPKLVFHIDAEWIDNG